MSVTPSSYPGLGRLVAPSVILKVASAPARRQVASHFSSAPRDRLQLGRCGGCSCCAFVLLRLLPQDPALRTPARASLLRRQRVGRTRFLAAGVLSRLFSSCCSTWYALKICCRACRERFSTGSDGRDPPRSPCVRGRGHPPSQLRVAHMIGNGTCCSFHFVAPSSGR